MEKLPVYDFEEGAVNFDVQELRALFEADSQNFDDVVFVIQPFNAWSLWGFSKKDFLNMIEESPEECDLERYCMGKDLAKIFAAHPFVKSERSLWRYFLTNVKRLPLKK